MKVSCGGGQEICSQGMNCVRLRKTVGRIYKNISKQKLRGDRSNTQNALN